MKDFQAQVFCLTGAVPGFSRGDIFEHIAARDGEYSERMTKAVTILIVGERGQYTSKHSKADEYGTETMPYDEFMAWMFRTPIVDKDAHLRPLTKPRRIGGAHVVSPTTGEKNGLPWERGNEELGVGDDGRWKMEDGRCMREEGRCMRNEELGVRSEESTVNCQLSTVNSRKRHWFCRVPWLKIGKGIVTILIVVSKAALVMAAVCVCVVFWLCGIPAALPK